MPACAVPNSQGFLAVVDVDVNACTGFIVTTTQEYLYLTDYTQITPLEVSQAVGFGFTLIVGLGYLSTYGVQLALRIIRLL